MRAPDQLLAQPRAPLPPLSRRAEAAWLCAALLLFFFLCALRAWDHPFPFYDDVTYLDVAARIRESGGLPALLSALFHGTWAEDNRNPLYLALLSLVAGRDAGFHVRAQLVGIALGALALVAAWWTTRRLFGARAALWMALLLACSETLVAWSSCEACEPLLVLFAALAFEQLLRPMHTRSSLFLGGIFIGLAQLTKGTGIFIAFAAVLALLWEARPHRASAIDPLRRIQRALSGIGCLLAGFALGGLPLFARNLLRFHSPLHNFNDRLLWIDPLDDFSEIFAPGALERLDRGPRAYLRALTPGSALLRIGRGLGETLVHLGDSLSFVSPRPFGPVHIVWIVLGAIAAGAALRLIWRSPRGFPRTLLLVHAAFSFLFFAFYNAVSGSSRYLMPLALTLLFPLARALAESGALRTERSPIAAPDADVLGHPTLAKLRAIFSWSTLRSRGAWGPRVLAASALAVLLAIALDPRQHAPPPGYSAAFDAVRARVAPGEAFAVDARSRFQPFWAMDPSVRMEILSTSWNGQLLPIPEVLSALRARGVRWVVLDGTSRKDQEPRWFFAAALPLEPDGSLPIDLNGPRRSARLPEGVRVAWVESEAPRHFALLELLP